MLRGHLSNVRCMAAEQDGENCALLVTAGGRAEVRLWRLTMARGRLGSRSVATLLLQGGDRRRPWREAGRERKEEPETRVMGVAARRREGGLQVLLACSDAMLRVLGWREGGGLVVEQVLEAGAHCLLQVVWGRGEGGHGSLGRLQVHQSGVNCVQVAGVGEGLHLVLTGGDDTRLVLCHLRLEGGQLALLEKVWRSDYWSHGCQVTGLRLLYPSLAVSVAVDQRVAVWRLGQRDVEVVAVRCGAVADPQGLEAWPEEEVRCVTGGH